MRYQFGMLALVKPAPQVVGLFAGAQAQAFQCPVARHFVADQPVRPRHLLFFGQIATDELQLRPLRFGQRDSSGSQPLGLRDGNLAIRCHQGRVDLPAEAQDKRLRGPWQPEGADGDAVGRFRPAPRRIGAVRLRFDWSAH